MKSETLHFKVFGAPLRAHLAHAEVLAILAAAGVPVPTIPAGCNTVRANLTLPSGEHALVSMQRGFAPIARDDEHEVNGALLLVLADAAWGEADARRILDAALQKILSP
jgi:hypothetical protein